MYKNHLQASYLLKVLNNYKFYYINLKLYYNNKILLNNLKILIRY